MHYREAEWCFAGALNYCVDLGDDCSTESGALRLIPIRRRVVLDLRYAAKLGA